MLSDFLTLSSVLPQTLGYRLLFSVSCELRDVTALPANSTVAIIFISGIMYMCEIRCPPKWHVFANEVIRTVFAPGENCGMRGFIICSLRKMSLA